MKIKLVTISLLMIFQFGCDSGASEKDNAETQVQAEEKSKVAIDQKDSSNAVVTISDNKPPASNFELLQGKWQHVEDKTNYLQFEGNYRKEIAVGMDDWDSETFTLSDKCLNEFNKDSGAEAEKDKYISCTESDLCWYIINLNQEDLSLSYVGRGNTLTYKRVK